MIRARPQFYLMDDSATEPTRGSKYSAGFDLYSSEDIEIYPGEKELVSTKIKVKIPTGYYGRIASRSGLSLNHNLEVGAGVIDYDYTGELKVILRNFDKGLIYKVNKGDRIAQLLFEKINYEDSELIDVFEIDQDRNGGFGSTGK